ncbi:metallophosphoesterase [Thermosulfurimonas sp. F29]|uniref:metallophosphoesterase family protein n=1 Tax=Thermosulfurimonas sp. F29 TaxID=2867247 RepID=UPI001C83D79D|nr:metallophosphoesterase [Thermosulfurimonas sp. F29]MBX6422836.1 metallophosphoesterase [Thermosulfurimonas sp. F29]
MRLPLKETRKISLRFFVLLGVLGAILGLEFHEHVCTLSATDWNTLNLSKIRIKDPRDFSFAVFGDNQFSIYGFERLLRDIDRDPEISFVIALGDMVHSGSKISYFLFLDLIQKNLHKPLVTVIGNHELKGGGYLLYTRIFGRPYYSFRIGRTCFLILDDAARKVTIRERTWLEGELRKSQDRCDHRLVFLHIPLYDPRPSEHHCLPKKEAAFLSEVFRIYGVSHVFAGHIHGYFQGKWNGTPYTITGGAGAALYGEDPKHFFYHYLKVKVINGVLDVKVKRIPVPSPKWFDHTLYLFYTHFLDPHWLKPVLLLTVTGLFLSLSLKKISQGIP